MLHGNKTRPEACDYLVINKNLICFTSTSNILIVHRQPNEVLFIFVPSERPYLKKDNVVITKRSSKFYVYCCTISNCACNVEPNHIIHCQLHYKKNGAVWKRILCEVLKFIFVKIVLCTAVDSLFWRKKQEHNRNKSTFICIVWSTS